MLLPLRTENDLPYAGTSGLTRGTGSCKSTRRASSGGAATPALASLSRTRCSSTRPSPRRRSATGPAAPPSKVNPRALPARRVCTTDATSSKLRHSTLWRRVQLVFTRRCLKLGWSDVAQPGTDVPEPDSDVQAHCLVQQREGPTMALCAGGCPSRTVSTTQQPRCAAGRQQCVCALQPHRHPGVMASPQGRLAGCCEFVLPVVAGVDRRRRRRRRQ